MIAYLLEAIKIIPIPKHSLDKLMLSKAIICRLEAVPIPLMPLVVLNLNSKSLEILCGNGILTRVHMIAPDRDAKDAVYSLQSSMGLPGWWYRESFSNKTNRISDDADATKYKNRTYTYSNKTSLTVTSLSQASINNNIIIKYNRV